MNENLYYCEGCVVAGGELDVDEYKVLNADMIIAKIGTRILIITNSANYIFGLQELIPVLNGESSKPDMNMVAEILGEPT